MRFTAEIQPYTLVLSTPLIDTDRGDDKAVKGLRCRVARVIRGIRKQGKRRTARAVLDYVVWIGYPVK